MKYFLLTSIIILLFSFSSCDRSVDVVESNSGQNLNIIGTWVHTGGNDTSIFYKRSNFLENDKAGFMIKPDGKLIERKNAGWCGTPPITYGNFDGTWRRISEKKLDINVAYWGGTEIFEMEIISIKKETMTIHCRY